MAEVTKGSKLLAEFLGTFLLVFTVGCNVLAGNAVWGGVSIACVLMVSIYALGGISGANFNPAVSLSLGLIQVFGSKGMMWGDVGAYMFMQLLGGIVAGMCYITLFWDTFNLAPAKGFGAMEAGMCEIIYTFMLCFVVLNVAAAKCYAESGNQFYGLAIGFVIVAGAYGAGAVSGGCFNPAVAVGIDVASAGMGFGWCISYAVFEFIGAAMAAFLFTVVRPQDFGKSEAGMSAKLTSEFLGTFMLVFTVGLNVLGKSPSAAYSIAASLMCMIYALGDVSGAHFNPAVTIAIMASGMAPLDGKTGCLYMVVQIIGAIMAGYAYSMIYHWSTFGLGPVGVHTWSEVAVAEIIFTFVLCMVVLTVAVSSKTKNPDFFGLAIGSCVTVGGFAIGGISGGSLNPAVSFGIAASHSMTTNNLPAAFMYSAFEIIGGVLAAGVVKVTHAEEPVKEEP